jgi:glutamate-5-semialdehyde dehydrogenase
MSESAQNKSPVFAEVRRLAEQCRQASRQLLRLDTDKKNRALSAMAAAIRQGASRIQQENAKDLEAGREKGLAPAMLDRLELTDKRIEGMAKGVEEIAAMRDPVGEVVSQWKRPGGFEVGQVRIPLGVIGFIYESRPNVTSDAAALCFKAGNATLLRGGSEAIHSNRIITGIIQGAFHQSGVPEEAVQLIGTTDRQAVGAMLQLDDLIDVIIPRGGKALIKRVVQESTIPVIKHYEGICHVFVHREADLDMALEIAFNAKAQRPGVCNAMETLLVDEPVAAEFLPRIAGRFKEKGVKIHGCSQTKKYIEVDKEAGEEDYRTEYLALTCNIRVVKDMDEAIDHISRYGSRHTESIVTRSYQQSRRFLREVDSSSVMVNASTRLADGGVYGLGAEIGISTDKLHAFGPMGVQELTAKKFVVYGEGALRT